MSVPDSPASSRPSASVRPPAHAREASSPGGRPQPRLRFSRPPTTEPPFDDEVGAGQLALAVPVTAPLLDPHLAGRGRARPVTSALPATSGPGASRVLAVIPHGNPATGLPLPPGPGGTPEAVRPRARGAGANGPTPGRCGCGTPGEGAPRDGNAPPPSGPPSAPRSERPATDVERWALRFVHALVEVLDGVRPAPQLLRWADPAVYEHVVRSQRGSRAPRGTRQGAARGTVRSMRLTAPAPDVAEVAVCYSRGGDGDTRYRVAAFRIEATPRRWVCTALVLG